MATRVPKKGSSANGSSRSRSGSTGRGSTRTRGGTSAKGAAPAKGPASAKGKKGTKGKKAAGRKPTGPDPLFAGAGKLIAGVWMLLAHGIGALARGVGRSARDLDPEHRRDGLGLVVLGVAIVVAATTWWRVSGTVPAMLTAFVRGAFGSVAPLVPVLLGLLAWRLLRHPDRNGDAGRLTIGWVALLAGVLGLVHVAHGTAHPDDGATAMRAGGGVVGFVMSYPLVGAVTAWVAVPLLLLVSAFGILVSTATPVHRIPDRLIELRDLLLSAEQRSGAAARLGRPRRDRTDEDDEDDVGLEIIDRVTPYDTPVVHEPPGGDPPLDEPPPFDEDSLPVYGAGVGRAARHQHRHRR